MGMTPNRFVRSAGGYSPRGECYEWCRLEDDGTLEFGEEQGNYAGGTTLSAGFYPGHPKERWPEGIKDKGYWYYALRKLTFIEQTDPQYFNAIKEMLKENGVSLPERGEICP